MKQQGRKNEVRAGTRFACCGKGKIIYMRNRLWKIKFAALCMVWGMMTLAGCNGEEREEVDLMSEMTETSEIFDNVKSKGYKYLLAYNEPDLTWESNVRPDVMQYRWNDCVNNKGNVRLGSPAVSVFPTWSNDWWTPF